MIDILLRRTAGGPDRRRRPQGSLKEQDRSGAGSLNSPATYRGSGRGPVALADFKSVVPR